MRIELPIGTKVLINGKPYVVAKKPSNLAKKGCKVCASNLDYPPFISANISIWFWCYTCREIDNDPSLLCMDDRESFRVKGNYTYFEKAKE